MSLYFVVEPQRQQAYKIDELVHVLLLRGQSGGVSVSNDTASHTGTHTHAHTLNWFQFNTVGCVNELEEKKSLHISFAQGLACRMGPVLDHWLVGSTCIALTHVSQANICYLRGRRLLADLCYIARISP